MLHYYGLDWIGRAVVAYGIYSMHGTPPKRAAWCFLLANLFSITIACIASPTIWGAIFFDLVFMGMHARNLWKWRKPKPTKVEEVQALIAETIKRLEAA